MPYCKADDAQVCEECGVLIADGYLSEHARFHAAVTTLTLQELARVKAADVGAEPFRSCRECGVDYQTEDDWRREYDKAAPRMLMPFALDRFRAMDECPRCLRAF